ncbi:MAG: DUF4197 domain-containing protein [Ignavibacteriales bacterium]|nr:DUF4197 domain-containing protein [Ignavibacteriales bacterium]
MKKVTILFVLVYLISVSSSYSQIKDILKDVQKNIPGQNTGGSKVEDGLKEALSIGSENAIKLVSQTDGFLKNPEIAIPLPKQLSDVEKVAKSFGIGKQFEDIQVSLNRAAESASAEAAPILLAAIKGMTVDDAIKIVNGADNAATEYFKSKTKEELKNALKPKVNEILGAGGVTKMYNQVADKLKSVPFLGFELTDLGEYVSTKSLDGIFTMLSKEELKIRKDPAARVTDLLKDVFGSGN